MNSSNYKPNQRCVPGKFATSEECVRCELCTNLAPTLFRLDEEGKSYVARQPLFEFERRKVVEAMRNCPISGIRDIEE